MAKAGRKRKDGPRYSCGKRIPPNIIERQNKLRSDKEAEEKIVVLSQPHRKGDSSQLCASEVGRFALANYSDPRDQQLFYDAAQEYARLVHRWRAAWGAPMESNLGEGGTGSGPSAETVQGWWKQIGRIDTELSRYGLTRPLKRMVVEDREQVFLDPLRVKHGLWIIAAELGRIDPKRHPFH